MSSKQRSHSLLTGLILLALAAGGVYAINRSMVANQGGAPTDVTPSGITTEPKIVETPAQDEQPTFPSVIVLAADGQTRRLLQRGGGEEKLLFTDADEQAKLLSVLGSNGSNRVFAWASPDPTSASGSLLSIHTDGSGKFDTLTDQLAATSAPAVSADGQTLAYVGFDNTEGSFGFTLYTRKSSGGNLASVETSPEGIALPAWSPDGKLAYVVGQATPDKGVELKMRSGENTTTVFTSQSKQAITDVAWLGDRAVAVVLEPLGNGTQNQASVVVLQTSDGSEMKSFNLSGKERSLRATKDGQFLAVVASEVKDASATTTGKVILIHVPTGTESKQGDAMAIAGFLQ